MIGSASPAQQTMNSFEHVGSQLHEEQGRNRKSRTTRSELKALEFEAAVLLKESYKEPPESRLAHRMSCSSFNSQQQSARERLTPATTSTL